MPELQQIVNPVDFAQRDRVEPIEAHFARKDHQRPGFKVEVLRLVLWVLEVHRRATLETQSNENLREGRMRINMGRYPLPRHVVIGCHLVEIAVFTDHVLCNRLI